MITGSAVAWQAVHVPWSAWYAPTTHSLWFPGGWEVDCLPPAGAPALTAGDITRAICRPIESPRLSNLARGVQSVCIAVDDLTRPTRAADVLPCVLDELRAGGVTDGAVRIVVATGTHGALDPADVALKVGPAITEQLRVEVHDAGSSVESTVDYGGRKLRVNQTFLEAELKIGICSVLPHAFAGYSGGAKLLLPGMTDRAAAQRSHKFVQMGLRGGRGADENGFRREIEGIARRLGFHFTVCCIPNANCDTAGVYAGDIVAAHRAACLHGARCYETPTDTTYDCLVVNAYPKDAELVQFESTLVALDTAQRPVVRDGGVVVVATAATRGLGRHGLFGPGGASYRPPVPKHRFRGREFWLYAPGVSEQEARTLLWSGHRFFRRADELAAAFLARLGPSARAAILPCAPLQQVVTR